MKIAALDSSGLVASAAIVEDDVLVAEYTIQYKKTHSQTLLPMLNEIKKMTDLDLASVDAFAVAAGPGSFTGLRIGSATVKGLAFVAGKPVVAVPTLEGLAYNVYGTDKIVCPLMDARRNQVYTGIYQFLVKEDTYCLDIIKRQCAVPFEEIVQALNELGREVLFLGDGVPVFCERMKEIMQVPYTLAPAHMNRQRAASIAVLGSLYYAQGRVQSAAEHAPEYLRLSQAERERNEQIQIRAMRREDVDIISRLEEETFSMPWSKEAFLEMIAKEDARYYVAEYAGKVVGGCGVLMIAGEGNITNVVVEKNERNRGIGTRMLQYLIEDGHQNGLGAFTLEVRVSNAAAIHLYEKLGFHSEGIRPAFYEKPTEDALIMWKR
ncbi:MAG: tRNA (adenosine(37)-N6)-threonylcarbamoyltransferase complex dimerization subunit type 1 TsaB [Roseburia sp.]|nr:tRNA (adenosine(37)-N6)-threonylcarbamoyltransferase complex dimerization subunit type 1 TsaB [Roseburia sp.]MCM1243186.1 tRNA (adenosine(37)-N6)-threonylcarbamoyltransferase complex dimerization subunit type 1 TsaB [Roseburia sp.]